MSDEWTERAKTVGDLIAKIGIPAAFGIVLLMLFAWSNYQSQELERERTTAFVLLTRSLTTEMEKRGQEHVIAAQDRATAAEERSVIIEALKVVVERLSADTAKNQPSETDLGGT